MGAEVGGRPDALHVVALHVVCDRRRPAVAAGEDAGTAKVSLDQGRRRTLKHGGLDRLRGPGHLLGIGVEVRSRVRVRSDRELDRLSAADAKAPKS